MLKFIVCSALLFYGFGFSGYLEKGNQFYKKGDFARAIQFYQKAEKSGENQVMVKFNKANALYQLGQTGRALVIYEHIIEKTPKFVRAYLNAGGIYFQMDEVGEALRLYIKAVSIDSTNTTAIKMVGESYLKLENRAAALEYFERGMRLDPTDMNWTYAILDVYLSLSDFASARDLLIETLEDNEDAEITALLAEMHYNLDDKDLATYTRNQVKCNPELMSLSERVISSGLTCPTVGCSFERK